MGVEPDPMLTGGLMGVEPDPMLTNRSGARPYVN